MIKLGSLIVGRDEECTAALVIKAALKMTHPVVYIDTGSQDRTLEVIQYICKEDIWDKRLFIDQIGIGPDLEISRARNLGLDYLRKANVDYFLKVDADDICFSDINLKSIVNHAMGSTPDFTGIWFPSHELYQYEAQNNYEWLENLYHDKGFFEMTDQVYGTLRIHKINCWAEGCWRDESRGLRPEGFRYAKEINIKADQYLLAHYGWARPMDTQIKKANIRYGPEDKWSPRVNKLHEEPWASQKQLKPFHAHPEIAMRFARMVKAAL